MLYLFEYHADSKIKHYLAIVLLLLLNVTKNKNKQTKTKQQDFILMCHLLFCLNINVMEVLCWWHSSAVEAISIYSIVQIEHHNKLFVFQVIDFRMYPY